MIKLYLSDFMEMMILIIGITGSIACGKSLVSNYLQEKGYTIIDADKIGHMALENDEVKKQLVNKFGKSILKDNEVNRVTLGKLVFENNENLKELNNIIHPQIRKNISEQIQVHKNEKLVFVDVPLLFEAKFDDLVEKIIVISLDEKIQLERLMNRNSLSKEEALQRIKSQIPVREKEKLGDYVVDNSFTQENTYNQVDRILEKLKLGE
ncbi:dephospho-CoA kinase [Gemella morbillorum]|uniref:dephospho-CoA kinase n=1 Tax=Gemella morbillorum TaxID=29391 RepID=UPI001CCDBD8B|nr:dephospho-CoA kinase [Gemella morbillorum]MDK8239388.1 dephospho-CoA kinase [Gemella morbillorum]MDK8255291.1 dephospho-CoA kinase [Gemella morbillorum]UBH80230.1 dephospho-CoA kinase [Gemella morbillorum]